VTGDPPSHPVLLDYLATQFVREGWSVKRLVRELVLSRTYQLGSDAPAVNVAVDPGNHLLWRHSPRRLDAEEIRDATLAVSGQLDPVHPVASFAKDMKVIEMSDNGPDARRLGQQALADTHRSVYLPLLRGLTPRALEVFDFADQGMVTGSRDSTTVAPQALYMLNDPFVRRQSLALAERLIRRTDLDETGRCDLAYRLTMGRPATASEVERALRYVSDYEREIAAAPVTALAAAARPPAEAEPGRGAGQSDTAAGKPAAPRKPKPPANPSADPANDEPIRSADPRTIAWTSFCQALLASAEFRFLR
jgi:Protein of unknown function (DUF1553)